MWSRYYQPCVKPHIHHHALYILWLLPVLYNINSFQTPIPCFFKICLSNITSGLLPSDFMTEVLYRNIVTPSLPPSLHQRKILSWFLRINQSSSIQCCRLYEDERLAVTPLHISVPCHSIYKKWWHSFLSILLTHCHCHYTCISCFPFAALKSMSPSI